MRGDASSALDEGGHLGEHDIGGARETAALHSFQRALLDDLTALERMLDGEARFDTTRRIGAEQEMFLVDSELDPADIALDVLEAAPDPRLTTEIALYNLEANLTPRVFEGAALSELEAEFREVVEITRRAAATTGHDVLLAGTLPTLRRAHLDLRHMTPSPRYAALDERLRALRGESFRLHVRGIEELEIEHPNVMVEAFNTSMQLHLQVTPADFARTYNVAQLVTGPILAAAANSPILLGHRLWRETRIAIFEQSVDARPRAERGRDAPPRVTFGDRWVGASVLELFRENVERYRAIIGGRAPGPSATELLSGGIVSSLPALRVHNGTIYRWNRPCFGVVDGVPHLRIEGRAFPAGPSIVDEVAIAALYFGLLVAGPDVLGDVAKRLPFASVKEGFISAARYGLAAQVPWVDGSTRPARDLLLGELLPLAREGLRLAHIDADDAERYLGVVREGVTSGISGASWLLRAASPSGERPTDASLRSATRAMLAAQRTGAPVVAWPAVEPSPSMDPNSFRTVGQFMTTDLYTVRASDALDVALSLMSWRSVRHVPVEDDDGQLVGLIEPTALLGLSSDPRAASDVMKPIAITITQDTSTREALRLLFAHAVSALAVVEHGRLVGLVTERDLLRAASACLNAQPEP